MKPDKMTTDELLRYADRSDPMVKELCNRLERYRDHISNLSQGMREASELASALHKPDQAE